MFISFAVFGIKNLIETKRKIQIENFPNKLQEGINEVHDSTHGQQPFSFSLPEKEVDQICFVNPDYDGENNLKLIKKREDGINREIKTAKIDHIDIESITEKSEKNSYCIENTGKEIILILKKEENNPEVIIKQKVLQQ